MTRINPLSPDQKRRLKMKRKEMLEEAQSPYHVDLIQPTEENPLTLQQIEKLDRSTIFATGIDKIIHPYFNDATSVEEGGTLEPDGKSAKVKWVAVSGLVDDWAIYHSMDANLVKADYFDNPEHLKVSKFRVARGGQKIYKDEYIEKMVPSTPKAKKAYRY